jgi:hypothetical protein
MRQAQQGERRNASSQPGEACRTLAHFLFAPINHEGEPANREAYKQQYHEQHPAAGRQFLLFDIGHAFMATIRTFERQGITPYKKGVNTFCGEL